ncbi:MULTISPECIES: aminotransferase class V-fold PLP-dependent enzyme [unclassified Crossiella]|uniref:aminotransferase class V-fold PLP-dependent enzyme n=1 Tax=unclassified Crossiella TaxID=2620835 RepID=UPI001FFF2EC5|nr:MULTISPECIES: aminotransferase class V-fold PLP-dependent enzyme [unclassified Crossiella]MCK2244673.1 aminotransferase class V-fold PLP-dependent enzyme [Crossiella sp. S99.2]MCK2258340.1 aminotransferase class V-fold PLP-dependent enzyme [Crossiella sp. S99.1]
MTDPTPERLTPAQFRTHFPITCTKTYLASCSQGALSDALAAALTTFQSTLLEHGNPWEHWIVEVERSRAAFAELIGATPAEIAIVSCASEGAFQAASGQDWTRRPGLVTTDLEFPSLAHVWLAQRARGAEVRFAGAHNGFADLPGYTKLIDSSCSLVSVPLHAYAHGQRLPVEEITETAHRHGARVLVDAYQGLGVTAVDVRELDCDYLVAGALKYLLGVPGIAFLYVRAGLPHPVDPLLTGWFGQRDTFAFTPHDLTFGPGAKRFQSGSPPVLAAYGAHAGLSMLARTDPAERQAHVAALVTHLYESLRDAGEHLASPADPAARGPQVALRDHDPAALAAFLATRGVMTSPRGSLLRIACHYYTSTEDIVTLLDALAGYRRCKPQPSANRLTATS